MKPAYELAIIVPCYNDADRISNLYIELTNELRTLPPYQLILVDDGSSDKTFLQLEQLVKKPGHITIVQLKRNFGQHNAILAGFAYVKAPYVAVMDSDLDVSPAYLLQFLTRIREGFDVVSGLRKKRPAPWWRLATSSLIKKLINRSLGQNFRDYGCMFRLYRYEVLDTINRIPEKKKFLTILTAQLGFRLLEIPVDTRDTRQVRPSRYSLDTLFSLFFDIVTGFTSYPVRFISYLGIFLFMASVLIAGYILYYRFFFGATNNLMSFIAVLIFMNGLLLLSLGILGEYLTRIYRQVLARPDSIVHTVKTSVRHE